ncbi:conserved exported hypothetical protein [Flavobacterium sp. 9AF]|uniref:hypothetical protein n=1 Tax=Flavobacterium sp. 9AF TaxID=2653142 RepID=UPI0012F2EC3F|nr:hypothetical protein [Flavobacterium sp. 9AF]VXB47093.1 conserved exported hypothetical protein [Flavobacterium sp. 9AF]
MKKINLYLTLIIAVLITSCTADNDLLTQNENQGGLVTVKSKLVGYVVGNGDTYQYKANFDIIQGEEKTTKVDVYKFFSKKNLDGSFTNSNRTLLKTLILDTGVSFNNYEFTFTYPELIQGLSIGGSPLPTSDTTLQIGESWTLVFVSTLTDGKVLENASTAKVAVGTRFAGTYKCNFGAYYRLGVFSTGTADWPGSTTIESVDETTYKVVEYFGIFNNNEYYFNMDSNDVITYPANRPDGSPQLGNGQPFITCATNPTDFADVSIDCTSTSNRGVRDNVEGKDKLYMSYGYFTTGSGPRVFYHELEKIVN